MIGNAFLLALREIRNNLLRSALTTLGIIIGVGAVIMMVTLGTGATQSITSSISSMGRNLFDSGTRPKPPRNADYRAAVSDLRRRCASARCGQS